MKTYIIYTQDTSKIIFYNLDGDYDSIHVFMSGTFPEPYDNTESIESIIIRTFIWNLDGFKKSNIDIKSMNMVMILDLKNKKYGFAGFPVEQRVSINPDLVTLGQEINLEIDNEILL